MIELIVDNFAGGGGASLGIEMATGRSPDIAVNHDPEAISMHTHNHPTTEHFCEDIWQIDPRKATRGRPVGLAWFSPDCKHFSKAKGGKPVSNKVRGLAWVVIRWAIAVKPKIIFLENVEEFADWGPLLDNGLPNPDKRGLTFRRWLGQLRNAGYAIEMRELRACDFGAPTSRKRLFIIARRDGKPIVWPEPTHGPGRLYPHRTAAECIDWSIPCPSIFNRKKPLAEATLRRIAKGVVKYVIQSADPFVIPVTHHGDSRVHGIHEPFRTITGAKRGEHALISPTLIQTSYGERKGQEPRVLDLHQPLGTVVAGGVKHSLVAAFLAKHNTDVVGQGMEQPLGTVTSRDHHSLVTSHLLKLYGTCQDGQPVTEPFPTVRAQGTHLAEVRSFLIKYYGTGIDSSLREPLDTVTTKDRFGLVTVQVNGEPYYIADIGMRMLVPRELFRAQGFPDSYEIDMGLSKTAQVRMAGNSVCPPIAAALIRANIYEWMARSVA